MYESVVYTTPYYTTTSSNNDLFVTHGRVAKRGRGWANKHRTRTHPRRSANTHAHTGDQHLFLFVMTLRFCCELNGECRKQQAAWRKWKRESGRDKGSTRHFFGALSLPFLPLCLHLLAYNLASAHRADGLLFCR